MRVEQSGQECSYDFTPVDQRLACLCTQKVWQVESRKNPEARFTGLRVLLAGEGRRKKQCLLDPARVQLCCGPVPNKCFLVHACLMGVFA
jgi:hypothetical protein